MALALGVGQLLALCLGLGLVAPAAADDPGAQAAVAEPSGYRTEDYRAAVPATLQGARVLSTREVEALWRAGEAAFIDAMPQPPKPANLPAGTVWRDRPRLDIPGSLWLPDTGYGQLAAATEDYLRDGLMRATGGNRARLVVVYCQANCWMSWNAAKRALGYGYSNVAWYPDGTDGWQAAHLPLLEAEPMPRLPQPAPAPAP
ncbi:MAG TPA: PQQ-dependent catabolism-associated CXXCW motif protein [Rhodopseudomonas sp.]